MDAFAEYNTRRHFRDQIKPHGFAITCFIKPGGEPLGLEDPNRFHLLAPYESDPRKWRRLPWFDLYTGKRYSIKTGPTSGAHDDVVVVRSYRDVLEEYRTHPEAKMSSGDAVPDEAKGRLHRHRLSISRITHIGKETNELEDQQAGVIDDLDEVLLDLGDPGADPLDPIRAILRQIGANEAASQTGINRVTIWRFVEKGTRLRAEHLEALVKVAHAAARKEGYRPGFVRGDAEDAVLAYVSQTTSR